MNDPIDVVIGLAGQDGGSFVFTIYDEGFTLGNGLTPLDFRIAVAVLRDLADACEIKMKQLEN